MWGAAPTRGALRAPVAAFLAAATTAAALAAAPSAEASGLRALSVSPKGSDRYPCTLRRPCRSFARAYRLALPGQTVVVRGGTYGSQTVGYDRRKRSSRKVLFRPAVGSEVSIRGPLRVSARYVEFRSFRVGSWIAKAPAGHVTFRSISAGHFVVAGASHLSVVGGTLGPSTNRGNVVSAESSSSVRAPRDLLLSGVAVGGYRSTTGGLTHCLVVRNALGLTIRNSRFAGCDGSAVLFAEGGFAGVPANVTLENNVFGRTGRYAVYLAGSRGERWSNFLIRNNSTDGEIAVSPQSRPVAALDFYSNIASSFTGCGRAGVSADYNVWAAGSACGPGDVVAPAGFVDPTADNFDLLPGSAAIDLSAAGTYASFDLAGSRRPIGDGGDAGAYESNSSGLVAAFALNESTGSTARDASSLGNAGVVSGASWTTSGRYGGALSFDGQNDWVTVADASSLDLANSMTLEAWVRPEALGALWRTVLIKEQPSSLAYALYAGNDAGKASGVVYVGGYADARSASSLPLNKWSHVATTYDGSSLRLYVNGSQVGTRTLSGSLSTSGGALRLGGNSVWEEWFDGTIDEVRVYNRPLSARQVKKDMTSAIRVQADAEPPTAPGTLSSTGATASSISVAWTSGSDNVGVAGYGLYRNGTLAGSASGLTYTFTGLSCGTTYTLAVDAYDAAGNRSARTSTTASTAACPPPDTQAPSAPASLSETGVTATTVSVAWTPSTDDVAVTGYELFRSGTSVGTTAGATYTFAGLACGTSYTLGVEAYDAAGNHSARASLPAETSACSPPPTPNSANVFVAANGSDGGSNCKRFPAAVTSPDPAGATLCRTFDAAYRLASPGDTVEVTGGSYPAQTLGAKAGASAPAVLIRPASGATVTVASLTTAGSYLTVRDITVATGSNHARGWFNTGSNVVLENVDVTGPWANVEISGGSNVTWKNSGLGTPGNTAKRLCASGDGEPMELSNVTNLLLSNIDFYPFQPELGNPICGPDSNMHLETIRVWDGVNGWRLERSRFHRGDGSGSARVFFSKISGADPANVTFVNNWFGDSAGTVSVYLTANSACTNYVFAYNHWEEGFVDDCSPKTSLKMVGNTGTQPSYLPCIGTVNIRNLWAWSSAGTCGTDRWVIDSANSIAALKYGSDGYHLRSDSPAIDAGETSECMVLTQGVDIEGQARVGTCDAGPDEYSAP